MKKVIITALLCVFTAAGAMAQGRIAFANTSATRLLISDGVETAVLGTASVEYFGIGPASTQIRLYAGLSADSLSPVLIGTAANQEFVLNTSSGVGSAQGTFPGGNPLPLPGFDGSAPVFLQYTATATPTTGQFAGIEFSYISPIISVTPALAPAGATAVFGPGLWTSGTLTPVPEPSSMALAGIGAASLLVFRRRK